MKKSETTNKPNYIFLHSKQGLFALSLVIVLTLSTASFSLVSADQFQAQINALNKKNNRKQATQSQLGEQASSLSDAIKKLQNQIDTREDQIASHKAEVKKLKAEIAIAEIELAKQKKILGETIKVMYLEGDISTVEMLASSKNLSDFFDKQQYRESVQSKVKTTLDKVTQLKLDLNTRKEKSEKLIAEEQLLKNELLSQRAKKDHILSLNQNQQSALDAQIKSNNSKIADLRAQQAIANRQLNSGSGTVAGDPGHGGYPSKWDSPVAQDSRLDDWGMYNRECVSYTAWKVYQTFGFMPYWGGNGNANEWPGDAHSDGIPTGSSPRRHSVAIWNVGAYGHAMWVEAVNGDGSIWVSQYNYDYQGHYSEMKVSASMAANLTYIYFR